jgi:hypothetical protein
MNIKKIFSPAKKPTEVFTPRQAEVNNDIYIHRAKHEKSLIRWLDNTMHGFIFGESGNGKTWLYKKVFSEHRINYKIANCTLAASKGSLRAEIFSACMPENTPIKMSYSETKEAGIEAVFASAGVAHEGTYEITQEDKLLTSFKAISKTSNYDKPSVIVLDNIETIINNPAIMDELADMIILLDDERYAKYKVKFLIVGVPIGVIEYFSRSKNRSSVSNRITELPSVSGFTQNETIEIVKKGFNELLKLDLSNLVIEGIGRRVYNRTLGVPQRVHEYCLALYYALEDNDWNPNQTSFEEADINWLEQGLRESYAAIEKHLTGAEGQNRKRQVLFTIGLFQSHQFTTTDIGETLRRTFTSEQITSDSGIGQILSGLTKGESPIIKQNKITKAYSVTDPRHIMCLRAMLRKNDDDETIVKCGFRRN